MSKDDKKRCCSDMEKAFERGTDNEGWGQLISESKDGLDIGMDLPLIRFCPWCGTPTTEDHE